MYDKRIGYTTYSLQCKLCTVANFLLELQDQCVLCSPPPSPPLILHAPSSTSCFFLTLSCIAAYYYSTHFSLLTAKNNLLLSTSLLSYTLLFFLLTFLVVLFLLFSRWLFMPLSLNVILCFLCSTLPVKMTERSKKKGMRKWE